MKFLLISVWFFGVSAWAQDFLSDFKHINQKIGQDEVDKYLSAPTDLGLDGSIMATFLPKTSNLEPKASCHEEDEDNNSHYEIILIAEASSDTSDLEVIGEQERYLSTAALYYVENNIPDKLGRKLETHDVVNRARSIWETGIFVTPSESFDPKSQLGKELFTEALVQAAAQSQMSEKDLSAKMASIISENYKSEEERYSLMSALSARLYRTYNQARNPGASSEKYNPKGVELPAGDLTLNEILQGTSDFDYLRGGVCNDISEAVAMVGEHLFPDKDVLVVNGGTHFAVVVSDGKENRVVEGTEVRMKNRLTIDPEKSPTNLRINKVSNGALREIAVVDTQMGQITEAVFETGKTLLKTDADISSLVTHFKNNGLTISAGAGKLSDSSVLIAVAKYEKASDKWKTYVGAGASSQSFSNDVKSKYQVHFRAGVERSIIRYKNTKTSLKLASGLRLSGMYTLNPEEKKDDEINQLDLSGGLDFYNRFDMSFRPKKSEGVRVNTYVELEHSAGPKNWGNTTGAFSGDQNKDVGKFLRNMTFHLNQVNVNVKAQKPVNSKITAFTQGHYQGSNIGQSVNLMGGVDIQVPNGAQLIVFTGYSNTHLKGFKTNHSLLASPSGGEVGARYRTRKGIEVNSSVKGIAVDPSVNAGVKVPILNKKKKKD